MKSSLFIIISFLLTPFINLSQNGYLDLSFANNGIFTYPSQSYFGGEDLTIDSNDDIFITGTVKESNSDENVQIIKLLSSGHLDNSFGADGVKVVNMSSNDVAYKSIIDSNGKLISVGKTKLNDHYQMFAMRMNSDGSLDNTFGVNGIFTFSYGFGDAVAFSLVEVNNTLVLAGYVTNANENIDFALIGMTSNGSIDPSFGSNGLIIIDINGNDDQFRDLVLDNSNNIIVCGQTTDDSLPYWNQTDFAVYKFNQNGNIVSNFGNNGFKRIDFEENDLAQSIRKFNESDSFLISGIFNNVDCSCDSTIAAKINTTGELDNTFADNGKLRIPTDNGFIYYGGSSPVIQDNGKIVFAGPKVQLSPFIYDEHYMRFDNTGVLDLSFGNQGLVIYDFDRSVMNSKSKHTGDRLLILGVRASGPDFNDVILTGHILSNDLSTVDFSNYKNQYLIYPNPASNVLFIEASNDDFGEARIYDVFGKLITTFSLDNRTNKIDLNIISSGFYFLEIRTFEKKIVEKLIIK
ncbi:MAG: putative delta-60 repeat protein [Flavobacteriales bacterium]|jgi:uncharacterized delta-60 repeat protein